MAGHNKWSKVKHKKGVADAKKSKVWTKIIREITVAAKLGGTDPSGNPRLRKALDDARINNLSKEPIQRALAKATGKEDAADYEELTYEGYGPGGVAILVSCLTDNRNRSYSEVRAAFHKNGGNLGTPGSVAFAFHKKGQILIDKQENPNLSDEMLLVWGLDAGLEEIQDESEGFVLFSAPELLIHLKDAIEHQGVFVASSEIEMMAESPVSLSEENSHALQKIVDLLEDLDDVQKVWTNEA
ncbi:MAG: YebC/PmpR family DNA-binding transcriptional regulator [Myxococcaceae bacterium]|nr:YebC/PmpR family DNA-binding transcriptional regulator [Myxococcaceae bacterium]MBH2006032.1 YebC/PmpR family DNA-binding transcriptional regulator [Myxococcaceae bacterium]